MAATSDLPSIIGFRYVVEAPIGRGGMAVVARVLDRQSGDRLALKQLLARGNSSTASRARMLFERECQTLALLDHPRIVRVLDYGVDNDLPYYTMELLDGGDLIERAPLPWQQACMIGRDVCSALSLLHARRMVYRDLSPRNVRLTTDGTAKLIDFGAMAPMGSAEFVVCTPSVAAPEVVNLLPLDGRADLYALGAVLFQTLTGRTPYPASNFQRLAELWKVAIAPPSAYVDGIPEALDSLVMELLKLEAKQRPASAAEVSERLCAIAGLEQDDKLVDCSAYLTTPDLTARHDALRSIHERVLRLNLDRQGASLVLSGATGEGRSRMLDASVSFAKLEGTTVLRIGGDDGSGGYLEVIERLAKQLVNSLPNAPSCASEETWSVLVQLVPSLHGLAPDRPAESIAQADVQARALPALRAWLLAIAQKNPLFVAVDDVERLDVESRNLIALLAERAPHHPLLFAVARCKDSELECDALRLIDATSSAIEIQPLRAAEVHTLLASVFGEVPHLQALSDRLYDLTNGNPRWLMQLAKHLVDQDVVKHQRGAWTLPENTSEVELPRNMAEATAAIVNHLSPAARALAEVFGLAGVDQYFELANIVYFSGGSTPISLRAPPLTSSAAPRAANGPPAKPISLHAKPIADAAAKEALLVTLTELTIASLLVPVGGTYRLAGREWIEPLVAPLSPRRERALHEQLAEIFRQRGDGPRQAFHLLRAGRHLDGIDALARFAEASCALTDADADAYLRFLENTPDDWRAIYGEALARAVDHPRRKQVEFAIRTRLLGILVHSSGSSDGHLEAQMHALAENAGLDILASLDPSVAAGERIKRAIGQAVARYGALPENEKVVDPMAALQALARAMTTASGHVANSMDFEMWRRLPSLRSVAALAPALSVVNMLAEGADARFVGRFGESGRIFEDLLSKLVPPNDMGLAPSYASGIRVGVGTVVGLYAAQLGDKAWETRAAEVAIDPIHASNALLVRALGELWQGDVQQSDRIEGERKLLRLEHRRPQAYEGLGVLWRFMGYVACDDLTRTRQGLDEIERFSKRSTTWEPAAIWARAEYERMRGAPEPALIHVDHALTRMRAGGHLLWASAATTRLLILTSLDRAAEALSDGERYLAAAREVGLDHQLASLYLATACAAAKQADASCAWAHLASAMAVLERYHAGGVRLGLAFEAAASAAIYLRDSALFEQYEARCRELYCVHENRTLAAKHERLRRAAIRAGLIARTTSMRAMRHATDTQLISKFEALLETCADPQQAIERTLQLIVADASARAGYLYTLVDDESVLLAHAGGDEHWEDGRATARTLLIAEHDEGGVTEDYEDEASSAAKTETATNAYQSVVVGHQGDKGFVVRGVMMLLGAGPVAEHTMEIVRRLSRYLAISEP